MLWPVFSCFAFSPIEGIVLSCILIFDVLKLKPLFSFTGMTNNRMNLSKKKKFLLKTHTQFDGIPSEPPVVSCPDGGLHSQVVSVRLQQPTPNSLVIQALIQQVCIYMEPDVKKRKRFYTAVCKILNEQSFLGLNFGLEELWPLEQKFRNVLSTFFRSVHEGISTEGLGSHTSLSINNIFDRVRTDYIHYPSRYQQNFEELETIAKGGFGTVCKAQNKIDGIVYAVKKIKFMYTNDLEYEKVLREVRSFAILKHQNIVNYNNSWLETNLRTEATVYANSSGSESYSSDSKQVNDNSSYVYETKSNDVHGISPVPVSSLEMPVSSSANPSEQSSCSASHHVDSLSVLKLVESQSVVISPKIPISHNGIVMKNEYRQSSFGTFEENSRSISEGLEAKFSLQNEWNLSTEQQINIIDQELENDHSVFHQVDESWDHSQKSSSRRRRHSSGPTCSNSDKNSDDSSIPRRRSYDRGISLDLDQWKCTDLVPKKNDFKWDISNLGVVAVLYIQMELCDQSLHDWLEARANLPSNGINSERLMESALEMFEQIVQGVKHIHSKSIIHRDLKPKNIFLCSDGFVKIGDFGLAALCTHTDDDEEIFHSSCSCSHTQGIGTVPYCAPEQKKGCNYDNKVDIYSLGIILIELLHRYQTRMEFYVMIDKILDGSIPIEFISIWPKELVNLIQRLISENPLERPEAEEVLHDLKILKVPELAGDHHSIMGNQANESLQISKLKAKICALEGQLLAKDEIIKELELKLLYSMNCDSFVGS